MKLILVIEDKRGSAHTRQDLRDEGVRLDAIYFKGEDAAKALLGPMPANQIYPILVRVGDDGNRLEAEVRPRREVIRRFKAQVDAANHLASGAQLSALGEGISGHA